MSSYHIWFRHYNTLDTRAEDNTITTNTSYFKIKLISTHVKETTQSTPTSVGLDLYCPSHVIIEPNSTSLIATGITIEPIPRTYAQVVAVHKFVQKFISTLGGVIDTDYRGNITVIMTNQSTFPVYI